MKTTFSICTDHLPLNQNSVQEFLTNEEKQFLLSFFHEYAEKWYPGRIQRHREVGAKKIQELTEKGFSPSVKEITKYYPRDHNGNIALKFFLHITWPNNHYETELRNESGHLEDQTLQRHYKFDSAFLNSDLTAKEMADGEKAKVIIERALKNARLEKDRDDAMKRVKELEALIPETN